MSPDSVPLPEPAKPEAEDDDRAVATQSDTPDDDSHLDDTPTLIDDTVSTLVIEASQLLTDAKNNPENYAPLRPGSDRVQNMLTKIRENGSPDTL